MRIKGEQIDGTLRARFWSRVRRAESDACWEWQGAIGRHGYGVISTGRGRSTTAHRLSWRMLRGEISEGLCVCHTCDNRRCVNPAHLFLGSRGDNNADARAKGRAIDPPRHTGEEHPGAKLTAQQVCEIRRLYRPRHGILAALGRQFGVSSVQIRNIVERRHWRNLCE